MTGARNGVAAAAPDRGVAQPASGPLRPGPASHAPFFTGSVDRRCVATTAEGGQCGVIGNLSAAGLCIWHDPERKEQASTLRSRGGAARGERVRAERYRTVALEDLPTQPLDDVDGVIAWLRWLAPLVLTGRVDPTTSREVDRILQTLRAAFGVRDLQQRIRSLEKLVKQYERERARRD